MNLTCAPFVVSFSFCFQFLDCLKSCGRTGGETITRTKRRNCLIQQHNPSVPEQQFHENTMFLSTRGDSDLTHNVPNAMSCFPNGAPRSGGFFLRIFRVLFTFKRSEFLHNISILDAPPREVLPVSSIFHPEALREQERSTQQRNPSAPEQQFHEDTMFLSNPKLPILPFAIHSSAQLPSPQYSDPRHSSSVWHWPWPAAHGPAPSTSQQSSAGLHATSSVLAHACGSITTNERFQILWIFELK